MEELVAIVIGVGILFGYLAIGIVVTTIIVTILMRIEHEEDIDSYPLTLMVMIWPIIVPLTIGTAMLALTHRYIIVPLITRMTSKTARHNKAKP